MRFRKSLTFFFKETKLVSTYQVKYFYSDFLSSKHIYNKALSTLFFINRFRTYEHFWVFKYKKPLEIHIQHEQKLFNFN